VHDADPPEHCSLPVGQGKGFLLSQIKKKERKRIRKITKKKKKKKKNKRKLWDTFYPARNGL
jgi:hypothetical protein